MLSLFVIEKKLENIEQELKAIRRTLEIIRDRQIRAAEAKAAQREEFYRNLREALVE